MVTVILICLPLIVYTAIKQEHATRLCTLIIAVFLAFAFYYNMNYYNATIIYLVSVLTIAFTNYFLQEALREKVREDTKQELLKKFK